MNEIIGTNRRFEQAARCLSPPLFQTLRPYFSKFENTAQEIRLRRNRPLSVVCPNQTYYFTKNGALTDLPCGELLCASREELSGVFQRICDYSVYARSREIQNGFVTLRGGHRAGICGTAVTERGSIVNIRDISSVNIRVAREHKGCADGVLRHIRQDSGGVLLCGAPCSGKTTVLRDLARQLSLGGLAVSLIDERSELAATASGAAQNDVGLCDVFDGYPKALAMQQALRVMSPQIIICDEIGGAQDASALLHCLNSGVRLIATAHAANEQELYRRQNLKQILATGAFSTFIFLRGRERAGEIASVVQAGERRAA